MWRHLCGANNAEVVSWRWRRFLESREPGKVEAMIRMVNYVDDTIRETCAERDRAAAEHAAQVAALPKIERSVLELNTGKKVQRIGLA